MKRALTLLAVYLGVPVALSLIIALSLRWLGVYSAGAAGVAMLMLMLMLVFSGLVGLLRWIKS